MKVEGKLTNQTIIKRGIRQGCVLLPLLFNLYSEYIFTEALHEAEEGKAVGGEKINNLRYADNTVVIAESKQYMQCLVDKVVQASKNYGLTINT